MSFAAKFKTELRPSGGRQTDRQPMCILSPRPVGRANKPYFKNLPFNQFIHLPFFVSICQNFGFPSPFLSYFHPNILLRKKWGRPGLCFLFKPNISTIRNCNSHNRRLQKIRNCNAHNRRLQKITKFFGNLIFFVLTELYLFHNPVVGPIMVSHLKNLHFWNPQVLSFRFLLAKFFYDQ